MYHLTTVSFSYIAVFT